jgi:dynein heavy chain 1
MADGPLLVVNGNGLLEPTTTINPEPILQYLTDVLKPLLGASERDLTSPDSLLHPSRLPDTLSRCARFAQEAQVAVLYIQKIEESLAIDEDAETNGTSRMLLWISFICPPMLTDAQLRLHDVPTLYPPT